MSTTKTQKFQIQGIGQIAINVHKFEEAVTFYRDVLELPMTFLNEEPPMAFFDCNGIRLMLAVPISEEYDHPSSLIYYRVDNIHAAHQALLDKGITFEQNPHSVGQTATHDVWMAFFRDPDNNALAIVQDIPLS
jgi:methylmalonyl-CoA/ethylmalonyl-CoA epimerase